MTKDELEHKQAIDHLKNQPINLLIRGVWFLIKSLYNYLKGKAL